MWPGVDWLTVKVAVVCRLTAVVAVVEGWLTVVVAVLVSWHTAVVAMVDVWLTVLVARVVGWLTSRVAREGSGLCCWLEPAEPWVFDWSGP